VVIEDRDPSAFERLCAMLSDKDPVPWTHDSSQGVLHWLWACCVRSPTPRILSRVPLAVLVQLKGVSRSLCMSTNPEVVGRSCGGSCAIRAWASFSVRNPENRSTRLSHDAHVGVQ
jgi:hypothetical protein